MASARRVFGCLFALLVAANVAVALIRILSIVRYGRLVPGPIEGPAVYAIWRAIHGFPLYEWPDREFFSLSIYNFLFYQGYARILGVLGIDGEGIPVSAHLLTIALASAGVAAQYLATRAIVPEATALQRLVMLSIAFLTWFGCELPGWTSLAVRPDALATLCSTVAVSLCLAAERRSRPRLLVIAGVCFFLGWAAKQSHLGSFAGIVAYFAVWRRAIPHALSVAAPLVVLAPLTVMAGGPLYTANIIEAARVGVMVPWAALHGLRNVFFPQLLVWTLPIWLVLARNEDGRRAVDSLRDIVRLPERLSHVLGRPVEPLVCAAAGGLAAGLVLLAKAGSDVNHLMDLHVSASMLCAVALTVPLRGALAERRPAVAAALLVPMVVFSVATVAGDRGRRVADAIRLFTHAYRPLAISRTEYEQRVEFARAFATLPKPVYVEDDMFGQPWFATESQHPAVILDRVYYDTALAEGKIEGGLEALIRKRHFASLLIMTPPWYLQRAALESGYIKSGTIARGEDVWQVLVRQ